MKPSSFTNTSGQSFGTAPRSWRCLQEGESVGSGAGEGCVRVCGGRRLSTRYPQYSELLGLQQDRDWIATTRIAWTLEDGSRRQERAQSLRPGEGQGGRGRRGYRYTGGKRRGGRWKASIRSTHLSRTWDLAREEEEEEEKGRRSQQPKDHLAAPSRSQFPREEAVRRGPARPVWPASPGSETKSACLLLSLRCS